MFDHGLRILCGCGRYCCHVLLIARSFNAVLKCLSIISRFFVHCCSCCYDFIIVDESGALDAQHILKDLPPNAKIEPLLSNEFGCHSKRISFHFAVLCVFFFCWVNLVANRIRRNYRSSCTRFRIMGINGSRNHQNIPSHRLLKYGDLRLR